jgi:hypothetical protein
MNNSHELKQETIEEAAERIYREFPNDPKDKSDWHYNKDVHCFKKRKAFINGARYQAERTYSEEEVRTLLETQRGNCYVAILTKTRDKELAAIAGGAPEPSGYDGWVKQFKKK